MRTILGVMLWGMLAAAPAAAQVTAPTDQPIEAPAAIVVEPSATPSAPAPQAVKEEQETLFGDGDIDHGGYGGPELKIGRVASGDAVFFGGKGGWIIDHKLVIGAGGWGMTNQRAAPDRLQPRTGLRRMVNVGYGGGIVEYFIRPEKVVHGTVALLIGGGGINLRDRDAHCRGGDDCMDADNMDDVATDSFFILEPEAGVELNIVKFMRLNAGISYRYVTGVGDIGFENDDLRSFNGTMTVRFGAF